MTTRRKARRSDSAGASDHRNEAAPGQRAPADRAPAELAPADRAPAELASTDPEHRGLWEATPPVPEDSRPGAFVQSMIGVSPQMRRVFRLVAKVAPTESTVLITGESGTGKEMVAHAIHLQSRRAHRTFVTVNAAAIPETLFESELFGHRKGAFTGAIADKIGLMKQADGGTLFLDEVAEMPLSVQAKLLRALQSGEIRRVGDTEPSHVDVRVIAATNRDLPRALREETLREDLYYRLSVFHIELPPLRDRRQDIPALANFFRERYARKLGKRVDRFTERAQFYLVQYDYPGNVRELENAIERAVTLAEHGEIDYVDLPPALRQAPVRLLGKGDAFPYSEALTLAQLEAEHIRRVLVHFAGNTTKAARSLGISRSKLWRKMREYGL